MLASLRLRRGLSQEELAHRSGLSVRGIRALERGEVRRPRNASVALLADALGLTGAERAAFAEGAAGAAGAAGVAGVAGSAQSDAARAGEQPGVVPSQLPPDIADFTGRDGALERLHSRVRRGGQDPAPSTAVVITAAVGKAGVGKTTLAVHAAHQLRPLFPDGQLYVNLRGAEAQALDPAGVLAGFLRALGVDGQAIPGDLDERAKLYRSLLADRRMLVLLDNAAAEAQVRPLLPAGPGSLVMVTSRSHLAGLAAADVINLDVLPAGQAVELLGKIIGAGRVCAEPEAARRIAELCGYLPLALRIVGARLAGKPHWSLGRLADRLDAHHRLDELAAGDLEVRASVALSYQGLGRLEQRAFRMLGLLEVPDFAPWMLSALLEVPAAGAEDLAERLNDAQLLDAAGSDAAGQIRYRFHDLIRLFARERLAEEETPAARRAALERTLQAYFTRAQDAVGQLRLRPPELPGERSPALPHGSDGSLADSYQWLATEHTGLSVSLDQAWREGLGQLGQALTRVLADFFEVHACWDEWDHTHEIALAAARLAGDRHAEASLLRGLGDLRRFQDRLPEAITFFTRSNALFRELDDTRGQIDTLIGLARTYRRQGLLAEASAHFGQSLELCRRLGDRDLEAKTMLFSAKVRRQLGQADDALAMLAAAGEIFRSVGSGGYAGYTDLLAGIICNEQGRYDQAACHLERALAFACTLGDPRWEAYALVNLAVTAAARGASDQARTYLEQSLSMFRQAGDRQGMSRASRLLASISESAGDFPVVMPG
jgi:tetratricopeptide (TPR) repeat protein/transcriptional regulator with XRE-family HTH domain